MSIVVVGIVAFLLGFIVHWLVSLPRNIKRNRELARYRMWIHFHNRSR